MIKGFGKNYFTLASIQATTTHVTLNAFHKRIKALTFLYHDREDEAKEEAPPDTTLLLALPVAKQCNCVFNQKCRLALKRTKLHGRPKCNCKHLSHRKTGISPPLISF